MNSICIYAAVIWTRNLKKVEQLTFYVNSPPVYLVEKNWHDQMVVYGIVDRNFLLDLNDKIIAILTPNFTKRRNTKITHRQQIYTYFLLHYFVMCLAVFTSHGGTLPNIMRILPLFKFYLLFLFFFSFATAASLLIFWNQFFSHMASAIDYPNKNLRIHAINEREENVALVRTDFRRNHVHTECKKSSAFRRKLRFFI